MSIVSLTFIAFSFASVLLYYLAPKRYQWLVLLIVSLSFYLISGWKSIFYLLFTSASIYFAALSLNRIDRVYKDRLSDLEREEAKELRKERDRRKKFLLVAALLANFGVLFIFKYTGYVTRLVQTIFSISEIRVFDLILPLGISFYTFQAVGYLIDVYRKSYEAEGSYFKLLLFLVYFPQITQGPIGRYPDLMPQLMQERRYNWELIKYGFQLILWGYFKKLVIADGLAQIIRPIVGNIDKYGGYYVFAAVFLYSIQIYCDFSGGIDIVSGISQAMGIELAQNFSRPFFASSLAEFWQRWHITLGQWMRDYVFYPIALSSKFTKLNRWFKKKKHPKLAKLLPSSIASLIVFLCVGVWHGSSLKYVAFGLYNGMIITGSLLLQDHYAAWLDRFHINPKTISWRIFQILRTLLICTIGRFFTLAHSFRHALQMFKSAFSIPNPWIFFDESFLQFGLSSKKLFVIFVAILILLLVSLLQEKGVKMRESISKQPIFFQYLLQFGFLFLILLFGFYGPGVDTTDFIYKGF